jgi:hypothetical protein
MTAKHCTLIWSPRKAKLAFWLIIVAVLGALLPTMPGGVFGIFEQQKIFKERAEGLQNRMRLKSPHSVNYRN